MNAWSTHNPLIHLLLQEYNPKFILELGIGNFSTPIFHAHEGSEKMFIENDKKWIEQMGIQAIHHELNVPSQDVPVHNISEFQKREIETYYYGLHPIIQLKDSPRLLFVDNYSCCRALAINILFPLFDLIIYHDSEPQSQYRNDYFFDEGLTWGYDHYDLQTPSTWASMFVSKNLLKKDLKALIQPIIEIYEKESDTQGIKLV